MDEAKWCCSSPITWSSRSNLEPQSIKFVTEHGTPNEELEEKRKKSIESGAILRACLCEQLLSLTCADQNYISKTRRKQLKHF